MMRAGTVLLAVVTLVTAALALAGCTVKTGPTEEFTVNEPLGGAAVTDLRIKMGAGKLVLASGASGLIEGVVRYNIAEWKPSVERGDARLEITQGSADKPGPIGGDVVNEWELKLGRAPLRLSIEAGAYSGDLELGGLLLSSLSIKDGAAKNQVRFSTPNPGLMEEFAYKTGASDVEISGLANANCRRMTFEGGAGSFTLDFGGELRSDSVVDIKAAAGSVRVEVPSRTTATVNVSGELNDVSIEGTWTVQGKTYSLGGGGRTLTINVDLTAGSLKLVAL